jgi:hypothetical protein
MLEKTKAILQVSGFKGKLAAHVMPWFGDGVHIHRSVPYVSNNPYTIAKQLDLMQSVALLLRIPH